MTEASVSLCVLRAKVLEVSKRIISTAVATIQTNDNP